MSWKGEVEDSRGLRVLQVGAAGDGGGATRLGGSRGGGARASGGVTGRGGGCGLVISGGRAWLTGEQRGCRAARRTAARTQGRGAAQGSDAHWCWSQEQAAARCGAGALRIERGGLRGSSRGVDRKEDGIEG
ncbi:hypothetical protein TRIUR3_31307 [Triticum urartu]|uniref:Uncharacterized protein n=1 Tax=Triticum urartu TaxID=4572 RepID=M7YEW0_TRIUA|nr:hypothetical protein TRIUR3_31307 [Triticum urartu]